MKNRLKSKIIDYIKQNYNKIDLISPKNPPLFNRACHRNACYTGHTIILTYLIEKNGRDVIVHFINKDNKNKYYDLTLGGYGLANYDYYNCGQVKMDYANCDEILRDEKKKLYINSTHKKWREKYFQEL